MARKDKELRGVPGEKQLTQGAQPSPATRADGAPRPPDTEASETVHSADTDCTHAQTLSNTTSVPKSTTQVSAGGANISPVSTTTATANMTVGIDNGTSQSPIESAARTPADTQKALERPQRTGILTRK